MATVAAFRVRPAARRAGALAGLGLLVAAPAAPAARPHTPAPARPPACDGANNWPAGMAFTHLKNAGLIDGNALDPARTTVVRLASERIGPDLYRQVHRVVFTETSGRRVEAITQSDASREECSMGGVTVFVVSRSLGGP